MSHLVSFLCLACLIAVYGCGGNPTALSTSQPRGSSLRPTFGGTGYRQPLGAW
jgi:hypothetical protein